jgi:hypothetical protein
MARRSRSSRRGLNVVQVTFWILSLIVVASMILAMVAK